MPIYMKVEPVNPDAPSDSDINGGVTSQDYEGWIALESLNFSIESKERETEEDRNRRGGRGGRSGRGGSGGRGGQGGRGGGRPHGLVADLVDDRVTEADLSRLLHASRRPRNTEARDATISQISVTKLLDRSSSGLFRWCAQDTSNEDAEQQRRVIEIHQAALAADGLDFREGVLEFRFEGCTPCSFDVDMSDPEMGPRETFVFEATEVTIYFLSSEADGEVATEYEQESFRRDDLGQNQ